MSTQEDRIANLEQRVTAIEKTTVSRTDLNQLAWQQGQAVRDRTYETAISLGILTDDVRILKENVAAIRVRVNEGFSNLSQELYSMNEKFTKRFNSLETRFGTLEGHLTTLEGRFDSLEGRFMSVEGKLEQVLQLLTPPPKTEK